MAAEKGPAAVVVANEGDAAIGGQSGGGFVLPVAPPKAATAITTDGWPDTRPLSEQLSSYPATCFLAALFVTVRREEGKHEHVCVSPDFMFAAGGFNPSHSRRRSPAAAEMRRASLCSNRLLLKGRPAHVGCGVLCA